MKVYKLPIPNELRADCDNCQEMPARVRLVIGGNAGERLCAACVGVLCMEISAILGEFLSELEIN